MPCFFNDSMQLPMEQCISDSQFSQGLLSFYGTQETKIEGLPYVRNFVGLQTQLPPLNETYLASLDSRQQFPLVTNRSNCILKQLQEELSSNGHVETME